MLCSNINLADASGELHSTRGDSGLPSEQHERDATARGSADVVRIGHFAFARANDGVGNWDRCRT